MDVASTRWIDEVRFDSDGLVPALAQHHQSGRVLMMAWMNEAALKETVETGFATYYSRSRQKLWRKGEESGHRQDVKRVQLDCDGDVLILHVEQIGNIACHTGRNSCFFRELTPNGWESNEPVLKDPKDIYSNG